MTWSVSWIFIDESCRYLINCTISIGTSKFCNVDALLLISFFLFYSTLALIRDHHPRNYLSVNEYFKLKKHASEVLNVKFIPPPMVPPKHLLKVNKSELANKVWHNS